MKRTLAVCAILACASTARGQCVDPQPGPGGFAVDVRTNVAVRYSDGYRTTAAVQFPRTRPGSCGWPVLVFVPGLGASWSTLLTEGRSFAEQGFFVVSYDVRGQATARALNQGIGSQLWAIDEWIDLAEIIEWVGRSFPKLVDPNRIGVFGDSQGGIHAWAAAAYSGRSLPKNARRSRPFPKVSCVVPRVFPPQIVDVLVPGGESFFFRLPEFAYDDRLASVCLSTPFRRKLAAYVDGDQPAELARWMRSLPGKDLMSGLRTTTVPIFHVLAWQDSFAGVNRSIDALRQIPKSTPWRVLVSTGYHGTPLNGYQFLVRQHMTLEWFERWLKSRYERVELGPRIVSAAMPSNPQLYNHVQSVWRMRGDTSLPPATTTSLRLQLRRDGVLSADRAGSIETVARFSHRVPSGYDGRGFVKDRVDLAAVRKKIPLQRMQLISAPIANDRELAGVPTLRLGIRPQHKTVQIGVQLIARDASGQDQVLSVGGRTLRGLTSGKASVVDFDLAASMSVLDRGTRVVLELASQVVQTPGDRDMYKLMPLMQDFDVSLISGGAYLSELRLPTRSRVAINLASGERLMSLRRPETRHFVLQASAGRAGAPYIGLLSLSGQRPLLLPGGGTLWFTPDAFTEYSLGLLRTPVLGGFAGILDATGGATLTMHLGLGPALPEQLRGRNLHAVPLVFTPAGLEAGYGTKLRLR